MKLVTTVHGWVKFTRRTPLYYGIDRLALRFYDRVVAVSEDLRQRCLATGVRENRCVTIKNAIDAQQYLRQHSRSDAKERLQFPQARFLVGAAGRLSEEKGFSLLIQAVDRLIRAGHDLGLVIAGEGDEREQLTSLIARLGQSERVRLLGYRADMLPFYEALDCFALSSLREGLPNVALEAMAMGTPVIATSVAGVPDLIQTGENGWQVAPGNELELAAALETLARDASLREKLGQAGQATILRDYSFERRMERMAEVYQQVLGPAGKETRV